MDNQEDNVPKPAISFNVVGLDAKLPQRATSSSVGYDLFVAVPVLIPKGETRKVDSGLEVNINDPNYYLMVMGKTDYLTKGLLINTQIIDNEYKGVLYIIVTNLSGNDYTFQSSERLGQITVMKKYDMDIYALPEHLIQMQRQQRSK